MGARRSSGRSASCRMAVVTMAALSTRMAGTAHLSVWVAVSTQKGECAHRCLSLEGERLLIVGGAVEAAGRLDRGEVGQHRIGSELPVDLQPLLSRRLSQREEGSSNKIGRWSRSPTVLSLSPYLLHHALGSASAYARLPNRVFEFCSLLDDVQGELGPLIRRKRAAHSKASAGQLIDCCTCRRWGFQSIWH